MNDSAGWYETFFREYDPALGRFMQVDPLAGNFASMSPYQYGYNNPLLYNDVMGDSSERFGPGSGKYWSDRYHSVEENANMMSQSTFDRFYGIRDQYGNYDVQRRDEVARQAAIEQGSAPQGQTITLPDGTTLTSNGTGAWSGYVWTETRWPGLQAEKLGIWTTINGTSGPRITTMGIGLEQDQLDFIYDNNNAIGLGIGIVEPGFAAAWDVVRSNPEAFTNAAKGISKVGGAGLVGLNVALTYYTISTEVDNGKFNTHSIVNGVVTGIGAGLAVTGLAVTSPVWGTALAVTGAAVGVGYGIAEVAGIDGWIDRNWGLNKK